MHLRLALNNPRERDLLGEPEVNQTRVSLSVHHDILGLFHGRAKATGDTEIVNIPAEEKPNTLHRSLYGADNTAHLGTSTWNTVAIVGGPTAYTDSKPSSSIRAAVMTSERSQSRVSARYCTGDEGRRISALEFTCASCILRM